MELHVRDKGSFRGISNGNAMVLTRLGLAAKLLMALIVLVKELLLDGLVAGSSPGIGGVVLLVTSLVLLLHRIKGATKISGKLRVFVQVLNFDEIFFFTRSNLYVLCHSYSEIRFYFLEIKGFNEWVSNCNFVFRNFKAIREV